MLLLDRAGCTWPAPPSLLEHLFPNDSSDFKSSSLSSSPHCFSSLTSLASVGSAANPSLYLKFLLSALAPHTLHPPYTPSSADPVFPLPSVACMRSFGFLQQLCSISPGGLPSSEKWEMICRVLWVCAHCSKPPRLLCTAASAPCPLSGDKSRKAPGMRAQKFTEQRKLPRIQVPIILFLNQLPWTHLSLLVSAGLDG